MLRNTEFNYGVVAIIVHWGFALAVFGMVGLGAYMVNLSYYHPWYKAAPHIHKSIGFLIALLLFFRLSWRLTGVTPKPEPGLAKWEIRAARGTHFALYLLPVLQIASGYLISTADGRSVDIFNWFEVSALMGPVKGMADTAGLAHRYLAYTLCGVVAVHALAALKHHFINRDRTLVRMLKVWGHGAAGSSQVFEHLKTKKKGSS